MEVNSIYSYLGCSAAVLQRCLIATLGGVVGLADSASPVWAQSSIRPPINQPSAVDPKDSAAPSNLVGPLRIVRLLWSANPQSAASALARSILTALDRGAIQELRTALTSLEPLAAQVASQGVISDSRYAVSLATLQIIQRPADTDVHSAGQQVQRALEEITDNEQRELLWRVWLATDATGALVYFAHQVSVDSTFANTEQASEWPVMFLRAAFSADSSRASEIVLDNWHSLKPAQQLSAVEPLTSNADSMQRLLRAVVAGEVAKDLINTNQLLKWLASENADLRANIESIWGRIRETTDKERQEIVAHTLTQLERPGAHGSARNGSLMFDRVCSQCHVFHGRGYEVGPNIVSSGRGSLQQLVSNILDPSLVIGEAFQAKTLLTVDGEIFSGLIVADDERYLRLKVQGGKVVEFNKDDIEEIKTSTKSLMPEGVEAQMTQQELFDLIAYLCLLKPLGEDDNELIPGTPSDFVRP